jgi:CRP/FNR family transcriptional regulator, cyclic AMP receptor protein
MRPDLNAVFPTGRIVKSKPAFDTDALLQSAGPGKTIATYRPAEVIFSQGDASNSAMYLQEGAVKLSVLSYSGKEAIVAILEPDNFFGEQALAGHPVRLEAATAMTATTVLIVPKQQMIRRLHDQHALSDCFITHMLARNSRRLACCFCWRMTPSQARRIVSCRGSLKRRSQK